MIPHIRQLHGMNFEFESIRESNYYSKQIYGMNKGIRLVSVHDGAGIKYKLMHVMVFF
jgi:hypothetical protein